MGCGASFFGGTDEVESEEDKANHSTKVRVIDKRECRLSRAGKSDSILNDASRSARTSI